MNRQSFLVFFMLIALAIADDDGQYRPGKYGDDGKYVPGDEGRYVHGAFEGDSGSFKSGGQSSFGQFPRPAAPKASQFINRFVVDSAASAPSPFFSKIAPPKPAVRVESNGFFPKPYNPDGSSRILKSVSEVLPDSYNFEFENDNSIKVAENGRLLNKNTKNEEMQVTGFYEYVGPDHVKYRVDFVADKNGFQPYGAHLPTPPPIPEEIARVLVKTG